MVAKSLSTNPADGPKTDIITCTRLVYMHYYLRVSERKEDLGNCASVSEVCGTCVSLFRRFLMPNTSLVLHAAQIGDRPVDGSDIIYYRFGKRHVKRRL